MALNLLRIICLTRSYSRSLHQHSDQFSRIFNRGRKEAFGLDDFSANLAEQMVKDDLDKELRPIERAAIYM